MSRSSPTLLSERFLMSWSFPTIVFLYRSLVSCSTLIFNLLLERLFEWWSEMISFFLNRHWPIFFFFFSIEIFCNFVLTLFTSILALLVLPWFKVVTESAERRGCLTNSTKIDHYDRKTKSSCFQDNTFGHAVHYCITFKLWIWASEASELNYIE